MKLFRRVFFFIVVVTLIVSCAPAVESSTQPTATPPIVPSATLPVIANTTNPSPTSNILSTPTTQPTPAISIEKDCLTLEDQLPSDLHFNGVWIRRSSEPYMENLEEQTKYRVPIDGGGTFQSYDGYYAISPNGKWLAYLDVQLETSGWKTRTNGYSLKVIHSSGHSLNMNYWPINFQKIYGWTDNEHLVIGFNNRDFILNPFTGKWDEIKKPDWLVNLDINTYSVDYSPHLDQVIIRMKDHSELRETNNGNLILSDTNQSYFDESWSPDGNMLGITTDQGQVIHIFRNRSEIMKVDLVQEGLASTGFDHDVYYTEINWAPDNNKLLLKTFDETLILDVEKQKIYNICFDNKDLEIEWFINSFFYSTKGQYVVVHLSKQTNYPYQFFDVLVDLDNGHAYKLSTPDNQDRIGWLSAP